MCSLTDQLFSPSSLLRDPHSLLDSPVYIYLSLCTYTASEPWSFSVPSYLHTRLLRDCWRHPLFDTCFLPATSGSVCPSASCWLLLFCVARRRLPPAPWYLRTSTLRFFIFDCFPTSRLHCVSVLHLSDYLVTESCNIKDNVFCIIPGLHLVPYLSVTYLSIKQTSKHNNNYSIITNIIYFVYIKLCILNILNCIVCLLLRKYFSLMWKYIDNFFLLKFNCSLYWK